MHRLCLAAGLLAAVPAPGQDRDTLTTVFPVGEVVVRASRLTTIEEAATGTALFHGELAGRSDRTLDQALAVVPGVDLATHTKGYTRVRLRGLDQDRLAILLDGIPISDVYSADLDLTDIPLANVGRIAISRGTSSSLYGTAGAAGVINAVSRRPVRPYLEASGELGSGSGRSLDLAAGRPWGRWYGWAALSYTAAAGFRPSGRLDPATRTRWLERLMPVALYGYSLAQVDLPAVDSYLSDTGAWDHTRTRAWEAAGKVGREWGPTLEAGVLARLHRREGQSNTYELNAYSDYRLQYQTWRDPVFVLASPQDVKRAALRNRAFVWPEVDSYQVGPYLRWVRGPAEVRLLAYLSYRYAAEQGYASTDHRYTKDQAAILSGAEDDPYNDLKTYVTNGVSLVAALRAVPGHCTSLALSWRNDSFSEEQQAVSQTVSPHLAASPYGLEPYHVQYLEAGYLTLAAQDEWSLGSRVRLSAGVSYDAQDFSRFKRRHDRFIYEEAYRARSESSLLGTRDGLNPVLGVVVEPARDRLKLFAALSAKTRFPALSEYAKIDSLHDHQLESERIRSASAGAEIASPGGSWRLRADLYHTAVHHRIAKIAGGTEPPVNIDRLDLDGVESQWSFSLPAGSGRPGLRGSLGYVYLRARNRGNTPEEAVNKGVQLDHVPVHQFIWDLRAPLPGRIEAALWGTHTRGQIAYAMRARPTPDDPNVPFSTDYFQPVPLHQPVQLNLRLARPLGWGLAVYLLLGNLLDDYAADPLNPGPGRQLRAGWTYER